ncbi:CoA transferase subunit A, partial [Streptomyces sp. NPDC059781]|uniref:CoA transferase subunit A n=1 Tax=Streptomyces sp. NPDC059781 TaxID=3346943 RepID=UPI00365B1C93
PRGRGLVKPGLDSDSGVGTTLAVGGIPWRHHADGSVAIASPAKETRTFGDGEYVLEEAITCDFALVRAARGDRHGNLVFDKSARNLNPLAAMAGRVTVAEVEELVEPGVLGPDEIHLPGVFVQRVVALTPREAADKQIERRTISAPAARGTVAA